MSDQLNPIDSGLLDVVIAAYNRGFTVQSDFARSNAEYVAMAASMGLITSKVYGNVYSRDWRPTAKGYRFMEELDDFIDPAEVSAGKARAAA